MIFPEDLDQLEKNLSQGIGEDYEQADSGLKADKEKREVVKENNEFYELLGGTVCCANKIKPDESGQTLGLMVRDFTKPINDIFSIYTISSDTELILERLSNDISNEHANEAWEQTKTQCFDELAERERQDELHQLFVKLWNKAGTTEYEKSDWTHFESLLQQCGAIR